MSGNITSFDPAKFIVDASGFHGAGSGLFSVQFSKDSLYQYVQLNFAPTCGAGTTTKGWEVIGEQMHLYFADPFGLKGVKATILSDATMTGTAYNDAGWVGTQNFDLAINVPNSLAVGATRLELIGSGTPGSTYSQVNALVQNTCAYAAYWDPVLATLTVTRAGVLQKTFTGVASAEHYVRVENGKPGVAWVALLVNGHLFVLNPLAAGEAVSLDVGSAMLPGEQNTVVVAGEGPMGATASVVVADSLTGQLSAVAETTGVAATDWEARIAQGYEDPSSLVLAVERQGSSVVLSWPGEQTGCVLQARSGPGPGQAWVDLTVTPELVAGRFTVTLEPKGPVQLFRLYQP